MTLLRLASRADLLLAAAPSQLPPLLRRTADVRRRHLDAEHRDGVARGAARAAFARPRGRHSHRLPLRPLHGARPRRRRRHRPARQPPHGDRHAVGADVLLRRARRDHAARARSDLGGLRDRRPDRHRDRLRRSRTPEPDVPDGRPRRAAERRRAQLEPLQHGAHLRAGTCRRPHRRLRRRLVLRAQHPQLPRRARRPPRDARARPLPARSTGGARPSGAARERASRTHATTGRCS